MHRARQEGAPFACIGLPDLVDEVPDAVDRTKEAGVPSDAAVSARPVGAGGATGGTHASTHRFFVGFSEDLPKSWPRVGLPVMSTPTMWLMVSIGPS